MPSPLFYWELEPFAQPILVATALGSTNDLSVNVMPTKVGIHKCGFLPPQE